MILWPCMLKLDGDNELIYLDSARDFNVECHELILSDDDYVIDSAGQCYLIEAILGNLRLIQQNRTLSTQQVANLIRDHEFNKASVCLTKIVFLSVSDAIKSLSL